jgi:integrase
VFCAWCRDQGLDPYSGEGTIALHITNMAQEGKANSTIVGHLAAIQYEYRQADVPLNMDASVLAPVREGIARTVGTAARHKAAPITPDELRLMLACLRPGTDPRGARDRALLLIGFGAALRRSEIVALAVGDIEEVQHRGLRVTVRRSKTDQGGAGVHVAVCGNPSDTSLCPVMAWRQWMAHRGAAIVVAGYLDAAQEQPLFCAVNKAGRLSGEPMYDGAVDQLIKQTATRAGLDGKAYSGHSLRRGLLTSASEAGVALKDLMRQARHKDPKVALGYIDVADMWKRNASGAAFGASCPT